MKRPSPRDSRAGLPDDLRRRHWTFPARTRRNRLKRALHDALERLVGWASLPGDVPVFHAGQFPWIAAVEREWPAVRRELDAVMQHREAMPNFQQILSQVGKIQNDDQWKTFFLKGVGMDCRENACRCPNTMQVLDSIPGCSTAFFSILSPHKHIPPHRGAWAGVLRLHLGLIVPEPRERCRIRIADELHTWEEGRCLVFDDTYNHQVWNDTEGYRVVLFVDFARPLRWPVSLFNTWLLNLAALAPFLREANQKQQAAERSFWGRLAGPGNPSSTQHP
ncbi:aspartyl/asparaginyl beta-hydroxylase domain-containing protein [Cyanobium sp. NIES-981]|uniref:aspartyl/asparaginyl beta-hydroxylase domain-containing protein n=1 Tax=Cyanobium sp. NIES-981 TaxID=1851505 RepID=UPI0007DDB69D|nr:aspartyl/asparaginyl beta-hydroxylase domain-containing protein [Cyanobium sp. NIES-981]SBO44817.1 Aspartyl/Asparaginyl beta-hydroxylase [Cyanobium sp. NIES-981]